MYGWRRCDTRNETSYSGFEEFQRYLNNDSPQAKLSVAIGNLEILGTKLQRALPKIASEMPDHSPNIPSFCGSAAKTYHEVAIKLCRDRYNGLRQLAPPEDTLCIRICRTRRPQVLRLHVSSQVESTTCDPSGHSLESTFENWPTDFA